MTSYRNGLYLEKDVLLDVLLGSFAGPKRVLGEENGVPGEVKEVPLVGG